MSWSLGFLALLSMEVTNKFLGDMIMSMVKQLNKTPISISLLSLLLNSEPHREALVRVLKQAYVTQNMSVDNVSHLVWSILVSNYISFNNDEIPPNGRGSTKELHISVKCKVYSMVRVLINNGSSINILPLSILSKLHVDPSYMVSSPLVV
ncbi:hypothetical protein J1N35_014382 [Gossypium stocksii]|uniref:Clathrin/coatomer adaptor adaptin-like N-terminal domain-containing protein n=1 Tax=Gossypium stocksii TaxID=47602 RepID=A0A9D4A9P1_9ROSI|nr:hypothetical protein J1N35_014382 [Gossypium stocksii]